MRYLLSKNVRRKEAGISGERAEAKDVLNSFPMLSERLIRISTIERSGSYFLNITLCPVSQGQS